MTRTILACLLMLALVLSGCLGDDPDPEIEEGEENEEEEEEPENRPPTSGLDADRLSGEGPLEVVFSLEADDPDGDNLTWRLVILEDETISEGTGNATDFPLEVTHEFTTDRYPGENFTVAFNITDGEFFSESNVTVDVFRAPNPVQNGQVDMCAKNLAPIAGQPAGTLEQLGFDGEPEKVDAHGNTFFKIEGDGVINVYFTKEDGTQASDNPRRWSDAGRVPSDAAYAYVCVSQTESPVHLPIPDQGAEFTYQDGLHE